MVWNKPRHLWQWILLFAPAILALTASQTIQWWMPSSLIMHYTNGMEVRPSLARELRECAVTLEVIVPASAIVAFIFANGASFGQRIVNTIFLFYVSSLQTDS